MMIVHFAKWNMFNQPDMIPAKAFATWPACKAVTIGEAITKREEVNRSDIQYWQDRLQDEIREAIERIYGRDSGQGVSTKESIKFRDDIAKRWDEESRS